METFEQHLHLPVTKVDDAERVLSLLKVRPPRCLSGRDMLLHHCRVVSKGCKPPCTWACMSSRGGVRLLLLSVMYLCACIWGGHA